MSAADTQGVVWTFDDFEPGAALGTVEVAVDARRQELWTQIYGTGGSGQGEVPPGLLVAAMMEAYLKVIERRPPGNVHAGQTLAFTGHRVAPGARLSFAFSCKDKVLKRERRWVTFAVRAHDGEHLALSGEISSIWAA